MQQIWLAMAIAAGVAFGFLIAWMSLRAERTTLYAKGRSDATQEAAGLSERLTAKDLRIQELHQERIEERELAERLREENAALRAAQQDIDLRLAEADRQNEHRNAAAAAQQERLVEQLKQLWSEKVFEQEARIRALDAELGEARERTQQLESDLAAGVAGGGTAVDGKRVAEIEGERDKVREELQTLREDRVRLETTHDAYVDRLEEQEARLTEQRSEIEQLRGENESLRTQTAHLQSVNAEWEARLGESRRALEEKLAAANDSNALLAETIRAASIEAFQANNQAFAELTHAALEKLQIQAAPQAEAVVHASVDGSAVEEAVRPLRESVERVSDALREIEDGRKDLLASLSGQVAGLVKALRAPSFTSGWNGAQLRNAVEAAGLGAHCDFAVGAERAGLAVDLAGGRRVLVDTKAPVGAYLEALQAADEETRERKLREHAQSVRTHVENLRQYFDEPESSPEFAVALVPNEGFLTAVVEREDGLIESMAAGSIFLATPATLVALLKVASYGWSQRQLADRLDRVGELGRLLEQNLVAFTGRFAEAGEQLEATAASYKKAAALLDQTLRPGVERLAGEEFRVQQPRPLDVAPRSLQALQQATGSTEHVVEEPVAAMETDVAEVEAAAEPADDPMVFEIDPEPVFDAATGEFDSPQTTNNGDHDPALEGFVKVS